MLSLSKVEAQLKKIDFKKSGLWGGSRVKELSKVLHEDEEIEHCVNGYYEGGFALLAATDQRLLLIDRKPMFLTIEAIWYDKIGQVDYNHRLMNATICVSTPNKQLTFSSWNHRNIHAVLTYSQKKMTEAKQDNKADKSENSQPQPAQQPVYLVQAPPANYQNYSGNPYVNPEGLAAGQTSQPVPMQWPITGATSAQRAGAKLPYSRRRYYAR
ncbi:MAG: PH domain-containing protein [Candidatus Saccharimonadales bacterium]